MVLHNVSDDSKYFGYNLEKLFCRVKFLTSH